MDVGESPSVSDTEARDQIQKNRQVANNLGLQSNGRTVISGEHTGLRNANGTADPSDDVPYPWGKNDAFLNAANTINNSILYLASDSSQINQNMEAFVPSTPPGGIPSVFDPFDPGLSYYGFALLPRFPTNVFYNVTNPAELTDEYNYIFYERYVNQGQDPCEIPGAICQPRTYQEILAAEADTALRHILSFKRWPHFFHQSNLRNYDGSGKTLQFDWLNAIIARYEQLLKLPLQNLAYNQIGVETVHRLRARNLNISGAWDLATNTVLLTGSASSTTPSANVGLTGLKVQGTLPGSSTKIYGGQRITTVPVGPSSMITLVIDQALTQ